MHCTKAVPLVKFKVGSVNNLALFDEVRSNRIRAIMALMGSFTEVTAASSKNRDGGGGGGGGGGY